MHELPLVFFTVFTQSAVGAFILLLIGGDSRSSLLIRRSADLPTADGGDLAFILHHGNDDIDAVDWRRRVGGIVWRAPSGATA